MTRVIVFALALVLASAGGAFALSRFRLIVPIEIDNLPAAVVLAELECAVANTETFDATRIIGDARTQIAIEGGRYSGNVGLDIIPRGVPVGTDGTVDGRSFHCTLFLKYRCATDEGERWCTSWAGGRPGPSSPTAAVTLFRTDPARPPVAIISGVIDRRTAETLPRRFQ